MKIRLLFFCICALSAISCFGRSAVSAMSSAGQARDTVVLYDRYGDREPDYVIYVFDRKNHSQDGPQARTGKKTYPDAAQVLKKVSAADSVLASSSRVHAGPTDPGYHFALRTNLLRWATATPDLGLEWRIHPRWSIVAHGSYITWSWHQMHRKYAHWEFVPEVRVHLGKQCNAYVGLMYVMGDFHTKLSPAGKVGSYLGGGISGGYLLKLTASLKMDFNVGAGYVYASGDRYVMENQVRVRQQEIRRHWIGPVHAGISLLWTIF